MYQFTNFPDKKGPKIEATINQYDIIIHTSSGSTICEINHQNLKGIANEICDALRFARDCGYEQAKSDIRKQLGV